MTKKMSKTKARNGKKGAKVCCTDRRNVIIGALVIVIVMLGAALIAATPNLKTAEEREYLEVYPHLLSRHVEFMYGREGRVCEAQGYGVSGDNDPYVTFNCVDIAVEDGRVVQAGEEQKYTLYFQHRENGYAEALAYE